MKDLKHIKRLNLYETNEINESEKLGWERQKIKMVFGDDNTIFKKFHDEYPEDTDFLKRNNGKVTLSYDGLASEWEDWVDFENSYAYIDNGKLYVFVYGIPEFINKKTVEDYFGKIIEKNIKEGYGETFETEPGNPICMVVERDGEEIIA
jgi:hypothetical protein